MLEGDKNHMKEMISFEDFAELWEKEPVVVIDSCSLLDMYRYSSNTTKQILNNFDQIQEYIWLPNQVLNEFISNKEEVKSKAFNKYTDVTKDVTSAVKSAQTKVSNSFVRYTKFRFPEIRNLEIAIEKHIEELLQTVDGFKDVVAAEISQNKETLKLDQVQEFIDNLLKEDRVGKGLQTTEKLKVFQEGENRYFYKIPPGYMDIDKDKTDVSNTKKFGDLIIWKELLKKSEEEGVPFIFITDDLKEDWWKLSESKEILAPREELISEFYEYSVETDNIFLMLPLSQFNNHISKINRSNNEETHQSFVEMNAEGVLHEIIALKDWESILNDKMQLTISLIHDGILGDLIGENIKDIDIHSISEPLFENLYVDFEDNEVLIDGSFSCVVEADVETSFSSYFDVSNIMNIEIKGNFNAEFTLDFEKQKDFINIKSSVFNVDDFEIVRYKIEEERDYSDVECVNCKKNIGSYHTKNNEPVCDTCLKYYEPCVHCGTLYYDGELGGYPCPNCTGKIDTY